MAAALNGVGVGPGDPELMTRQARRVRRAADRAFAPVRREVNHMETTTAPAPISVPAWAWLFVALAAIAVYAVTMDNGLVLAGSAETVHELFHDARHFIGAPCH